MPTTYYLRVEGVNLSNFVFDTDQLSVIRGGSLLLLHAIKKVAESRLKALADAELTQISTGASVGLFSFVLDDPAKAQEVAQEVRSLLVKEDLQHATFVVDCVPLHPPESFNQISEKLIALNRWRQMQSPSLAIPVSADMPATQPCAWDGVRPANPSPRSPRPVLLADSTWARREYGRKSKHTFYQEQVEAEPTAKALRANRCWPQSFAQDFNSLSQNPAQGNLDGKLAVFYADGNSFGSHQRKAETPEQLQQWDTTIKQFRRVMLANLLNAIQDDPEWLMDDGTPRFETLLWGGDELMFVAPAWKGIELTRRFLDLTGNWRYPTQATSFLTHAIGLVFCHHNAPIHPIRDLVQRLADAGKKRTRAESTVTYAVLESFDHIGTDLATYMRRIFAGRLSDKDRVFLGGEFETLCNHLPAIRASLGRGRVYDFLHDSLQPQVSAAPGEDPVFERLCHDLNGTALASVEAVHDLPSSPLAAWAHVAELWDYVPEPQAQ
ncbi:MAG: hypothetical protein Q4G70_02260 [Pseudomonadota bacterium]|nr:hypothetical protein [Pseudomonadota bacterium]